MKREHTTNGYDQFEFLAAMRSVLPEEGRAYSLHEPSITAPEFESVYDCLKRGWVSSAGPIVHEFEERLAATIGADHVIALNSAYGISVLGFAGNTIAGNSIYDNSLAGIVWFAGTGTESPAPVITIANSTTVTGTADSGVRIDIYSDSADEGRVFEGTALADSSGDWSWNGNPAGPNVTATATTSGGTTSVFSVPIPMN